MGGYRSNYAASHYATTVNHFDCSGVIYCVMGSYGAMMSVAPVIGGRDRPRLDAGKDAVVAAGKC
jgi:hypothetical protein